MSKLQTNLAWDLVEWPLVQKRVFRTQCRIYKAKFHGNKEQLHKLQKLLIHSKDAKLLAVLITTTLNKGRDIPRVDEKLVLSATDKIKIVNTLTIDGVAKPIQKVWIPKPKKIEKWPLGIPTIKDRAKQVLAKLALEPEWEAVFEGNSYGFRPGRSAQDAIEAIFVNLNRGKPKWVFDADIRKCFDKMNHHALIQKLDTFPEMKIQIEAWLKADIMEGYANAPKDIIFTEKGTPQGGIISLLLANIALHGLEKHLLEFVEKLPIPPTEKVNRGKFEALSVIRYADDFIITHGDKQIIDLCITETERWLLNMGLEYKKEKSQLKECRHGFKFLGFQIIQVARKSGLYKVKIRPSKESNERLLKKVREIVLSNRASSSYRLILKLRPIIIGWANYFRYCECSDDFKKLSHLISEKIRPWAFRRDTRHGKQEVKEKYFPSNKIYNFQKSIHKDNWVLTGTYKSKFGIQEVFLPHMHWVKSSKYVKVFRAKSPFDGDHIYWSMRNEKHASLPARMRILLQRQKQKCPLCGNKFRITDLLEVDHIIPKELGGKDFYSNLQLLHRYCHIKKTAEELKPNQDKREQAI